MIGAIGFEPATTRTPCAYVAFNWSIHRLSPYIFFFSGFLPFIRKHLRAGYHFHFRISRITYKVLP
jgi:hypothetical protein